MRRKALGHPRKGIPENDPQLGKGKCRGEVSRPVRWGLSRKGPFTRSEKGCAGREKSSNKIKDGAPACDCKEAG